MPRRNTTLAYNLANLIEGTESPSLRGQRYEMCAGRIPASFASMLRNGSLSPEACVELARLSPAARQAWIARINRGERPNSTTLRDERRRERAASGTPARTRRVRNPAARPSQTSYDPAPAPAQTFGGAAIAQEIVRPRFTGPIGRSPSIDAAVRTSYDALIAAVRSMPTHTPAFRDMAARMQEVADEMQGFAEVAASA